MPFAATWTDLEIIIPGEVSQTKTNIICYCLNAESKKKQNKTNELINKTEITYIENKCGSKGEVWEG